MLFSSLLTFVPLALLATSAAAETRPRQVHKSLAKRLTGELAKRYSSARWSFYDVGLGACGQWNVASDFIVALNAEQFGSGYPGPNCFKKITMSYNGKTATATIMDRCPGCPYGGLDLSRGLFTYFASEDIGIIYGEWSFVGDGAAAAPATTKVWVAPTTTTKAWVAPTTTTKAWVAPTTTKVWVAPTTTTKAWVAPTTTTKAWVAPTTTTPVWVAPTTTSKAWVAPTTTSTKAAVVTTTSTSKTSTSTSKATTATTSSSSAAGLRATSASHLASSAAALPSASAVNKTAQIENNLAAINDMLSKLGELILGAALANDAGN